MPTAPAGDKSETLAAQEGASSAAPAWELTVEELFTRLIELSKKDTSLLRELGATPQTRTAIVRTAIVGRLQEDRGADQAPSEAAAVQLAEDLLATLKAAGLVEAADPSKASCVNSDLAACRFVDARSLMRLPRTLYKRGFYRESWFKKRFSETRALRQAGRAEGSLKRLVRRIRWLGDRFDPRYRPKYESGDTGIARLAEIDAAARGLDLAASYARGVRGVVDRLVRASVEVDGPPLLLLSRTPEQESALEQRLREVFLEEYLIECRAQTLDTCTFTTKKAIEEIPHVLYKRELYNWAWFERHFAAMTGAAAAEKVRYRRSWAQGWLEQKKKLKKAEKDRGVTVAEIAGTYGLKLKRAARDKLFKDLKKGGLLLPGKPECQGEDGEGVRVGEKLRRRANRLTGKGFDRLQECHFKLDDTVRWLFDRGDLSDGRGPRPAAGAGSKSLVSRLKDLYGRRLLPYFQQLQWSPYELRLPLTMVATLGAVVWVLLFPMVTLVARSLGRESVRGRDRFERSFGFFMLGIAGVAFVELQPYVLYHWHYLKLGADWSVVMGAASIVAMVGAGPALSFFKKFGRTVVLVLVSLLGPLLPFVLYLSLMNHVIYSEDSYTRVGYELHHGYVWLIFIAGMVLVHLFLLLVNPNSTGMHDFYKGRLATAYLLAREGNRVVGSRDLPLAAMCPDRSGAPYHLLNVALNVQGNADASVRDRNSDFFMLSRLFVGGGRNTGYCRTRNLEEAGASPSLGTAMAVSGAAAAPNMGSFTVGPLVILLALLNIRLGYWIPNPLEVGRWLRESAQARPAWRLWLKRLPARMLGLYRVQPGPYLFLRELFSWIHDKGRAVNISDGGHLENTGILELLRRRCRLIIASDAEADPKMNFAGLAAVQRFARLDLGVEIEMDTARLRRFRASAGRASGDSTGRRRSDAAGGRQTSESARHFAVGRILYPKSAGVDEETGYLIYLKTSLTGDESQIVAEYHGRRPQFPHESTADQFFDESQFEAYRELGVHIARKLYDELEGARSSKQATAEEGEVLEWLQTLGWKSTGEAETDDPQD